MGQRRRQQEIVSSFARNGRRLVAAAVLSALLAACGGGGGGGGTPAASTPPTNASASPSSSEGLTATPSEAKGTTTLSWTPPTAHDDGTPLTLTGYRIYWGHSEGHYPHSVTLNNPGLTRYVVENLTPAKWYFVATALSAKGESPPSNVVAMEIR